MLLRLLFTIFVGADAEANTLAGMVENDAGRPVAGATVFIRTAGPRQGVGDL
jgi:hypothetical protein